MRFLQYSLQEKTPQVKKGTVFLSYFKADKSTCVNEEKKVHFLCQYED